MIIDLGKECDGEVLPGEDERMWHLMLRKGETHEWKKSLSWAK